MKRRTLEIMDTTLRDGEQTSGMSFSSSEKLTIAKLLLEELKVDRIEIASARVSDGEFTAVKNIAKWAKENNYKEITWTFDPLVARNAKLNILKLGVDISAYYPNFYGDMPDELNAGDESDRVMASLKVVGDTPTSRSMISTPDKSAVLIAIPDDIVAIRGKDLAENLRWRRSVRDEFVSALARGGKVIGFSTNNEYVVQI